MNTVSMALRLLEEAHDEDHEHDHDGDGTSDVFGLNTTDLHDDDVHHNDSDKPWGDVIAASFVVQLITFVGIFVSAMVILNRRFQKDLASHNEFVRRLHQQIIPSFASGALLATTVFLLIPESFTLLQTAGTLRNGGHDEEAEGEFGEHDSHDEHGDESYHWKFGTALLGGFILPVILGAIFPPPEVSECEVCQKQRILEAQRAEERKLLQRQQDENQTSAPGTLDISCEEGACCHSRHGSCDESALEPVVEEVLADSPDFSDLAKDAEELEKQRVKKEPSLAEQVELKHQSRNIPLACSILLGDAFHNFTDGIFLGNAFLLCSRSVAYTIMATTVYHELAQEIADYALLVTHCGFSTPTALLLNFLSSFSIMIGSLIILSLDLSNEATGIILAMSAGVYGFIAATECVPRVMEQRREVKDTLIFLVCFSLGASPIGLVLLNHGHCEAAHEAH